MKKRFLLILSVVLLEGILPATAYARQIETLTNFSLPAWQGVVSTSLLTKATTNAPWVINITSLANASSVDTYLANSDGDRRSDYTIVGLGRHEINDWGQANYLYKAVLMNHTSQSSTGYLTGSWSPDNQ
jgi:hypothetical protein